MSLKSIEESADAVAREDAASQQAPYGYCPFPNCHQVLQRERRPDGNDVCPRGHAFRSSENAGLKQQPPVPQILPYPNSLPGVLVYYKLEGHSGWSSWDIESARAEVERFHKSGRIRPRILKITETQEVVE